MRRLPPADGFVAPKVVVLHQADATDLTKWTHKGGQPPSYNDVAANDREGLQAKWPTFEPLPHLGDELLAKE